MEKLNSIQTQFYNTIFNKQNGMLTEIKSDFPGDRINIYRQTILENLRHALQITYPGLWALLGQECADSAAYVFCNETINLPSSGNLDDWGKSFPTFLGLQPELLNLPYLNAYGEYEWLKHLAYGELEGKFLTYADFAHLSESDLALDNCTLNFHPTVSFIQSDFPLDKIQEIIDKPNGEGFDLRKNTTYGLIARSEESVVTYWISEDNFIFFQNIENKLSLADCIENTENKYPNFSIIKAIDFLMVNKLISGINHPH